MTGPVREEKDVCITSLVPHLHGTFIIFRLFFLCVCECLVEILLIVLTGP